MGLAATAAAAALVAYVQLQCGTDVVELLDIGVAESALVGDSMRWEGDPCAPHPILRLTLSNADGPRRLTVRPSFEPTVRKNAVVVVSVQRGPLTLTTPGTLLHDAVIGQRVKVRNDTAHVAISGVLTHPEQVEIR